ncbi:hypothetical protein ACGFIW_02065 [Micromonospora sp. NPDC048935]|uniref:hypothetical protein n=1 Tax=Micromonospora sp. NPDC048935 TaxID=3364262 RepID=UPI003710A45A
MTRGREFADAIPSMRESEVRASREEWRAMESRRHWRWIFIAAAVATAVLLSALLFMSGGVMV